MASSKQAKSKKTRPDAGLDQCRNDSNIIKAAELAKVHNIAWLNQLLAIAAQLDAYNSDIENSIDLQETDNSLKRIESQIEDSFQLDFITLRAKVNFFRKDLATSFKLLDSLNLLNKTMSSYSTRYCRLVAECLALLGLCRCELKNDLSKSSEELYSAVNLAICHFQEINSVDQPESFSMSSLLIQAVHKEVSIYLKSKDYYKAIRRLRCILRYQETAQTKSLRQAIASHLAELFIRVIPPSEYRPFTVQEEQSDIRDSSFYLFHCPKTYHIGAKIIPQDLYQESLLLLLLSEFIANQNVILNRSPELVKARGTTIKNTQVVYDLLVLNLVRNSAYFFLSRTLENSLKFSFNEFHIWYQYGLSLITSREYYRAYLVLRECQRIQSNKPGPYILASCLCFGNLKLIDEGTELISKAIEVCTSKNETFLLSRAYLVMGWGFCLASQETKMMSRKRELQFNAIAQYRIATKMNPNDYLAWYHLALELANQRYIHEALTACQKSLSLNSSTDASVFKLLALIHSATHHQHRNNATTFSSHAVPTIDESNGNANIPNAETTNSENVTVNDTKPLNIPLTTANQKKCRLDLAVQAIQAGLIEHPHDFGLMFTLARLEFMRTGPKGALNVYRRIVEQWRDLFGGTCAFASLMNSFNTSETMVHLDAENSIDSSAASFNIRSLDSALHGFLSPNRLELIMSEVVTGVNFGSLGPGFDQRLESYLLPPSSFGGPSSASISPQAARTSSSPASQSTGHTVAQFIQIRIYAGLSELYLDMGKLQEARECIEEACSISRVNHNLLYLRARVLELRGRIVDARAMYESVIALSPGHLKSLLALGRLLNDIGETALAERVLKQALSVDPNNSIVWKVLGDVLSANALQDEMIPEENKDFLSSFPLVMEQTSFGTMSIANQMTAASKAYLQAINLEQTEPVEPFYTLPIGIACT